MTTSNVLPIGFKPISGGIFNDATIELFGIKKSPVTNEEWARDVKRLVGEDRFFWVFHDWKTGKTRLEKDARSDKEGGRYTICIGIADAWH